VYYVLECLSVSPNDHAVLSYSRDHPLRSWKSGARFSPDAGAPPFRRPPAEPIRVEVQKQAPGVMAELWDNPLPLMTRRLYDALRAAGVDNMDTYAAEIRDPTTGKTHTDHVAFNLIGTIAAADLSKTTTSPASTDRIVSMDINSLAVDEAAPRGALMFRLAESVNAILVHESVMERLKAAGFETLTFLRPEEWAG
jgi:hypothetical protein